MVPSITSIQGSASVIRVHDRAREQKGAAKRAEDWPPLGPDWEYPWMLNITSAAADDWPGRTWIFRGKSVPAMKSAVP